MNFIYYKTIITCIAIILLASCAKNKCEYPSDCEPFGVDNQYTGITVVTFKTDSTNGQVGGIYDTRNNLAASRGTDWGVALNTPSLTIRPASWTRTSIGQIFGIAIDNNANVYLAASGVYGQNVLNTPYQNSNPGRIYKASPPAWTAATFVDLPVTYAGSGGSLNGIGNIAHDKVNDQLFATNLDDGKIYRISMAGTIIQAYDPWASDGGTPDITIQDERIWGVGVNYENGKVKVYFARITTPVTTISNRNLYSITLSTGGAMPASAPVLEVANLPGNQTAFTDIEFSGDTKELLMAERGDPHNSIVVSYTKSGTGWVANYQYFVGGFTGKNSAGGIDFAYEGDDKTPIQKCSEMFWASGNYLEASSILGSGRAYGLQGIKYAGNTYPASQTTDLYIDYNPPVYNFSPKGDIGDVDVFDANSCFCIKKR